MKVYYYMQNYHRRRALWEVLGPGRPQFYGPSLVCNGFVGGISTQRTSIDNGNRTNEQFVSRFERRQTEEYSREDYEVETQ